MKTKSIARLIYEALLGEPADERSAYPFADALRAYASTRPAPSAKFFGYYLKRHLLISDGRHVEVFTLKHVQLPQNEELDFGAKDGHSRSTHYMKCFAGFVGAGGLLLAFKDLLELDRAVWNDEQRERFGKLIRPSFWRALDAYGVPLNKIAQTVLEWSEWWCKEVATIEAPYRCLFPSWPAYSNLLGTNKLSLLLAFEELNKSVDEALSAHVETMSPPRLFRRDEGCLRALERRLSGEDRDGGERGCPEASDGRSGRAVGPRRGAGGVLRRVAARRALSVRFSRAKSKGAKAREASRRTERSGSASPRAVRPEADVMETTPPRAPSSAASSLFPDLELKGTAGGVPYLRLSEPGADFTNSKNERAQLSAWMETLDRESTVTLLRRLSMYRAGSLYQFMLVWCQAAEGFDPLTGKESSIDLNFHHPNDEGRLMWNYIETRSATQHVNLQRILHLLLYLYSNDRLTTRMSSTFGDKFLIGATEQELFGERTGRPGELVRKMTDCLRNKTGGFRICTGITQQKYKSPAHRKAAELWTDEQNGPTRRFESLAPGWVDYMLTYLGSLKRLLKFPPFDDAFPSPLLQ